MRSGTLENLFDKQRDNTSARARFEAEVGWCYGLTFGVLLLLVGWGVDAAEQYAESSAFFWVRFVIALSIMVPVSVAAAAVAGRAFGAVGRKILVWVVAGAMMGWLAIHISFEGASLLASLVDPAARGLPIMPFTAGAQERVVMLMLFGAAGGILTAVLQMLATGWAWDRSTVQNRMTISGWIALLASIPLALGLGAVYDGVADSQLRAPSHYINRVIQFALNTPPDLDRQSINDTGRLLDYVATSRWRGQFTPQYTLYLAQYDAKTLRSGYEDAQFGNGFIWRCEVKVNGSILGVCSDVRETYRDYVLQFLRTGVVKCDSCVVQIEPEAASWRTQQGTDLADLEQVSLVHHMAGVIVVDVSGSSGKQVECRFYGAEPVVIHDCARIK